VIERGKAAYSVNCAFCHGNDAGGSVGPNLLRSEVVLLDNSGELIGPIVHGARADRGMPKIDISDATVSDIAAWLHSLKVGGKIASTEKINIVVGNAQVGKAAFDKTCGSCHSVTGDLQGFAAKYTDPRAMQQAWIMPGAVARGPGGAGAAPEMKVPPTTATVTFADGKTVTGKLEAVDDFYVAIVTDDGQTHRYGRMNDSPKVDIHDPLAPHRELLRKYDDKDIHDITAYLESLK
jgi:mono/diheme cytochrome c family protein